MSLKNLAKVTKRSTSVANLQQTENLRPGTESVLTHLNTFNYLKSHLIIRLDVIVNVIIRLLRSIVLTTWYFVNS